MLLWLVFSLLSLIDIEFSTKESLLVCFKFI